MARKYKISTSNINTKIIERFNQIKILDTTNCVKNSPTLSHGEGRWGEVIVNLNSLCVVENVL